MCRYKVNIKEVEKMIKKLKNLLPKKEWLSWEEYKTLEQTRMRLANLNSSFNSRGGRK
jgi:hypothetical protein|tara:strand:+ start:581 stop:754 length:174 start_codon:yes stop_codon:yes gene_type:complete